jgi:asparagine synthase (glutamine-hydrolysing)
MCGIFGQNKPITPTQVKLLNSWLAHRGPDDQQAVDLGSYSFYHSRLAIQDAPGGGQPMQRGPFSIVFNGEIYNHWELRQQFGLECKQRSDTETLLALYEKLGVAMFEQLDGMFAMAIYNKHTNELLLARDRMGEKPLYYYHHAGHFAFSSELNALAANFPMEVRSDAMEEFLAKGWVGPATTIYQHVYSVPPAHYMFISVNHDATVSLRKYQWWMATDELEARNAKSAPVLSRAEGKQMVMDAIEVSVERRMHSSDLPVGCFLSGGIDSGIVTALAARHTSHLHTFTFNFEGVWDESALATEVARRYHTNHTNIYLDYNTLESEIGHILLPYGEPFCDDSAIPSYYVAREAKKYVTVVLNGDGGDEVFGGYRRYVPALWPGWVQGGTKQMARVIPRLKPPKHKMSYYNYLYRLLKMQQPDALKRYLASSTDLFWEDQYGLSGSIDTHWIESIAGNNQLTVLQKSRLLDYLGLLPEVLLRKIDIATMQHALESRTVFFSPDVLKASAAIADRHMLSYTETKTVLRSIAADLLPASIASAPKRGFEPPLQNLLEGPLKQMISDYLMSKHNPAAQILGPQVLENILLKKTKLASDKWARQVYAAFSLCYWYKHRPTYHCTDMVSQWNRASID